MRRSIESASRPVDFFVSYSPADERWATWIAWELETAGYSTMLQAWDFVPGTNFIDFMDRGVSEAAAVISVLSSNYLASRYGRLEWQAALRADPDDLKRLVTIRVEDCALDGLLSMITYVDLVGVTDPQAARALLLGRIRQALDGRAKPTTTPGYPTEAAPTARPQDRTATPPSSTPPPVTGVTGRRAPVAAPAYPPAAPAAEGARSAVTVLHVPGPRFGRGLIAADAPGTAEELQARIYGDLTRLTGDGAPPPDLLVVTGDITETGSVREFTAATEFLTGLRVLLGLEPNRLVVVPGPRDITAPACRAYFASCEADDVAPRPPYWPKWRHFSRLFEELYQGLDDITFDGQQPWTLFAVPDLRVAVAGLNSTINDSHREDDHYGWIGESQAAWFAQRLRSYEQDGWLRVGAIRHAPWPATDRDGNLDRDPALLRDTVTFDGLLGRRLNLVLHGPVAAGAGIRTVEDELTLIPPAGPDQCQLLQLSAEGLARIPCRPTSQGRPTSQTRTHHEPETLTRGWHAVDGTFAAAAGGPSATAAGGPETPEPLDTSRPIIGLGRTEDQPGDPTHLLLDRIAEVCQTRHDNPKIRLVEGEAPHLVVSYRDDGFVRQQRVAAHVGELTGADIERFLGQVHAADPDTMSELVYQGPPVPQVLRIEAMRRGLRVRSFIEFQGLLDLREFVAGQTARLRADTLYPPDLYVPQRFRELTGGDRAVRRDLTGELLTLLASDEGRFVLLMGDFGRGKTFALREVARRIPTELPHLIPILLELRTLEKAHSVEAMVAAHLAGHGEDLIDLKAFHYMLREGRIVLLFDGFDELATRMTYDRAADHLDVVLRAADGKAKILISSRSQHFRTDDQVLTALGERVGLLAQRRVLSIEDFTQDQIRAYLGNRYGGDSEAADSRLALLSGTQGLLGLSQNPRMLSFIADLDESRLQAVAESGQVLSAAFLYQEILNAWLSYEERRTGGVHGAAGGLTRGELWQAVTTLAVRLWESGEQYLETGDIADVAETLSTLSEGQLTAHQTLHAVAAGSLLVRTEDGLFGLIHGSVVEWLVARAIAEQLDRGETALPIMSRRPLSQLSADFLCDLADTRACQRWLRRVLADRDADEVTRLNAIKISTRLRSMARTDLRGAVLRGEDLSHRELADADLTGADLTDARLVGTDLSRAVLRDAVLVGARLDEAKLAGADLTGADLSRARMPRADLRDVVLTGSRWRRAALIDVSARQEFFAAPELRGAAVAPGQPVEAQFAPAAVGVSYGFEIGRLPQPVGYSSDGQALAIGSDDGGILICDTASGLPLRTLHGHRGRVYAVAYGPGDGVLASGASDCIVSLWDPMTGVRLHRLAGCQGWVWPMVFNPASSSTTVGLATGDNSGTVRLWDTATGQIRHELPGHAPYVWTARFSPDGAVLATGDSAGTVRLWDTATGTLCAEFPDHTGSVYRLGFSPDSAQLATADHGGTVRLYDIVRGDIGRSRLRQELTGHQAPVYAFDFHPDGGLLVSGDTQGTILSWDLASGQGTRLPSGRDGATYWVTFSPGGDLIAIGGNTGLIRLWDTKPPGSEPSGSGLPRLRHELAGHKGSAWPIAFRPDGHQLATSSNDGTTRLWDPATGQCTHLLRGHGRRITSVQFDPTGGLLATSGNDGVVRLWDPRTGHLERRLTGIADRLIAAFFDPVSGLVATPSNDGDVHLWNAGSGGYERSLDADTDYVWAATFSPDGDIVATANDDDTVQLWYRTTGRRVRTLGEHRGRVRSIAFSPDGDTLATGCDDRAVRLWDAHTGVCRQTLREHTDRVYSVQFSPDSSWLLSASHDGTARIWDSRTGAVRGTLAGHTGRLWSAALDPAGTTIATAGDDLVVRLWDAQTGEHRHTLDGHTRRVWSVAFSPDGRQLASAGDDGTVRIWDLGSGAGPGSAAAPAVRVTLLGLAEGWAALAPDGSYKLEGTVAGEFWHVVGSCRFEPGDMDEYLPAVRQLPMGA
ncbi:MAG TPA: TIR domain-containing protein, partial [Pseudonocardiaceae bacterium]